MLFRSMRAMPDMVVMEAADAVELEQIMEASLRYEGPTYLRIVRCACERIVPEGYQFQIGKALKLCDGCDITLIGSGLTVAMCLKASKILAKEGISAEVLNISTIKPIDKEAVINSASKTGHVITAENHSIIGGLGSAVAEVLSESCPVKMHRVGIEDSFGKSGQLDVILEYFGITESNIATQARKLLYHSA